jgi:hypothetical protein
VIKGFADVFKLIETIHGEGGQTNRKLLDMNNIISIGTKIIGEKFKIDDFMRLQPEHTVTEKESNLVKLIQNEEIVLKKVKKSNYEQLIK